MLDKNVKVKEIRDLGSRNFLLTLSSPEQARLTRAGQFVMVKCSEEIADDPLLRRPFSVFDIRRNPRTGRPSGLDILVKDVGRGTHRLIALLPGGELRVLGPQGRPFAIRTDLGGRSHVACLVAGGVGIAALYLLARDLLASRIAPILFYGGRSAGDLVLREHFERLGIDIEYTTEDGTLGERGIVTAPLDRFLSHRPSAGIRIYACGPWGMMKAAHEVAVRRHVPCEVSLEARMGCSLGACMGCVVRTFDEQGDEQYLRVCLEGPIMDSRVIDWNTPPL